MIDVNAVQQFWSSDSLAEVKKGISVFEESGASYADALFYLYEMGSFEDFEKDSDEPDVELFLEEMFQELPHQFYLSIWVLGYLQTFDEGKAWCADIDSLELLYGDLTPAELPENLGMCVSLRELDFSDFGELTHLPASVAHLTALHALDLSDNLFEELPRWIGSLINLKEFSVADNKLTSLPAEMGKLVGLKKLYLDGNPLLQLPASMDDLVFNLRAWSLPEDMEVPEIIRCKGAIIELENLLKLDTSEYETQAAGSQNINQHLGLEKLTVTELNNLAACIECKLLNEDTFHWKQQPLPAILCKIPFYAYAFSPIDDCAVAVMYYGTLARFSDGELESGGVMDISDVFQSARLEEQVAFIQLIGLNGLSEAVAEDLFLEWEKLIAAPCTPEEVPTELISLFAELLQEFDIEEVAYELWPIIRDYALFLERTIWDRSYFYTNSSDDPGVFVVDNAGGSWNECFTFLGQKEISRERFSELE